MNTTRRFWFYTVTLITLGIFITGVGQLLALLFDVLIKSSYGTQIGGANFHEQQLSLGLAMMVIGGPLWFFFWQAVQRRVKGNPEEIGAALRKLFLNFILLISAITAIIAASDFIKWLFSGVQRADFSPGGLATMIVAGIVWFYHRQLSESEGHPSSAARTLRRWYVYPLALFGLVWLAVGLVQLINTAFSNLPIWGNILIKGQFWNSIAQSSIAMILLGAATWYMHWFRMARDDFDSTLRQVYFYLATISGGAITALVYAIILLDRFFLWVFGGTVVSAVPRFQFLGWAVPAILVGIAIWGYHLRKAQEEAGRVQERRQSSQRIYYYLMAILGLGTTAAGLSNLFGILIDTGTSLTVSNGWWQNQLAISLGLLLVGTPLWLYYWNGILKRVQTGGITEWRALSRRIFLYVIVGTSIILLAADLVNIIYQLLRRLLQGNPDSNFMHAAKWSLQTLIVAAALLWYHWQVLRADQRRGAETVVTRKHVTLLADDRTGDLAARLENKLGYQVRTLYQLGQTGTPMAGLPDEEIDNLVSEIQSAASSKIMLVQLNGKITVLPYREK